MKPSRPPTVCGLWKCPENAGTFGGKADLGMPECDETLPFMAAPLMSTWQNIALHARRNEAFGSRYSGVSSSWGCTEERQVVLLSGAAAFILLSSREN